MPNKILIVAAGVPGSGKSTALSEVAYTHSFDIVCPDDIRFELFGDAADQREGWRVFQIAYDRMRDVLADQSSHGVIFDATNCRRKARRAVLSEAAGYFDYAICAVASTPLDECLARNSGRERVVPEDVIEQMFANLHQNWPSTDEGFDDVVDVLDLDEALFRLEQMS